MRETDVMKKNHNIIKTSVLLMFLSLIVCANSWAISPVAKIIKQSNIPIVIKSYNVDREDNRLNGFSIKHEISYKNTGKQRIEAIEFSFVSFDVWNEFLNKLDGVSMSANDVGDSEKGTWIVRPYGAFSFQTGFVYVNRIRYEDGIIWIANRQEIRDELKTIQVNFDIKNLESKPDK